MYWLRMVRLTSDGRWLTTKSEDPFLQPSLAIHPVAGPLGDYDAPLPVLIQALLEHLSAKVIGDLPDLRNASQGSGRPWTRQDR